MLRVSLNGLIFFNRFISLSIFVHFPGHRWGLATPGPTGALAYILKTFNTDAEYCLTISVSGVSVYKYIIETIRTLASGIRPRIYRVVVASGYQITGTTNSEDYFVFSPLKLLIFYNTYFLFFFYFLLIPLFFIDTSSHYSDLP